MRNDERVLAVNPKTFAEAREVAEFLQSSPALAEVLRENPAGILMAIATGQELGLEAMAALRGMNVIDGRMTLGADAMVGVVLGSGLAVYFRRVRQIDETEERAVYETLRKGSPDPQQAGFSMEDAERAGLLDDEVWQKYPQAMLRARAKSILARDVYPDLLMGLYTENEAGAVGAAGDDDVEDVAGIAARLRAEILETGDMRALHAVGARVHEFLQDHEGFDGIELEAALDDQRAVLADGC